MRKSETSQDGDLFVRSIAGTHVILLAMDYPKEKCEGLLGFAIHRTDHTEKEAYWLKGMKIFPSTNPHLAPGSQVPTNAHPVQDFAWSDYSAKPNHDYTYRIQALKGTPAQLAPASEVSIRVQTESPEGGDHDVYFNRGASASQEYARRYGNRKPGDEGGEADPAWEWLSRGNFEAITGFIDRAVDANWGIRVAAYEFHQMGVLRSLKAAIDRGVDVKIVHDADVKSPGPKNRAAMLAAGIADELVKDRITKKIAHNKMMILLKNGAPAAVLLGSTNFSDTGVFGHSNVVHIVEDAAVAKRCFDYWTLLEGNPEAKALQTELAALPLPTVPPAAGTSTVFSPRLTTEALDYYVTLAGAAKDAIFTTFAFGMDERFVPVYETGAAPMRFALFDKLVASGVHEPKKTQQIERLTTLRKMVENRFSVGSFIQLSMLDRWLKEQPRLGKAVRFIHTKYMLIDPLSDDPIVISGSANFSEDSCNGNDENMLVIRGNKRVADIYLTEFMRSWHHYAFREWAAQATPEERNEPEFLKEDDSWWSRYFGEKVRSRQRKYFTGRDVNP